MKAGTGADVADLTLVEVRDGLAAGEVSAVEVAEATLARAERFAGRNLFISALPEHARHAAAAADRGRASGASLGRLHGVPVTVKDNIDMAGLATMEAVRGALGGVDVLAMPTMPVLPLRIADAPDDPIAPEAAALLRNTWVINQFGHPAVSLPMTLAAEGVPMGFQLVGHAHDDHGLLAVAEAVERLVAFGRTTPTQVVPV